MARALRRRVLLLIWATLARQPLGGWPELTEALLRQVHSRLRHDELEFLSDAGQCAVSPALRKLRVFFSVTVSDWLSAPPTSPRQRHSVPPGVSAAEAEIIAAEAIAIAEGNFVEKCGCLAAQAACELFSAVVRGEPLGPGFVGGRDFAGVGSTTLTWYEAVTSDWPLLGLAAQALRLEAVAAKSEIFSTADPCAAYLESMPFQPRDTDALALPAVRFLEEVEPRFTAHCHLATALAVAVLAQSAPRQQLLLATQTIVGLLSQAGRGFAKQRSTLFFLLDRAHACQSEVEVQSSTGRTFPIFVFPFRDHISDQVRTFHQNHCGFQNHGVSLDEEVADFLVQYPNERMLIVEIGAGFGQCLLPALLQSTFVEALAVEPSRQLRMLMAKSFERNRVTDQTRIVPAYVTVNASQEGFVDLVHKAGHYTVGKPRTGPPDEDGLVEHNSAYLATLPALIGQGFADLLLIYPAALCHAMVSAEPPIRCFREVRAPESATTGMCAFAGCPAAAQPAR